MMWLKKHTAIVLLSFALFLMLVSVKEVQMTFGGYKGLLGHSLRDLVNAQNLGVYGQVTLDFEGVLEGGMSLPIDFEGDWCREGNIGQIDFELISENTKTKSMIASYRQGIDDKILTLYLAEAIEVDLNFLDELTGSSYTKEDLNDVYEKLQIDSVLRRDHGFGKGLFKQEMTRYTLDVADELEESNFEKAILPMGTSLQSIEEGKVRFLVNGQGELTSIEIIIKTPTLHIEGWVCLEVL